MASADEVSSLVSGKITDVNAIASDAVASAQSLLEDIADALPGRPPYFTPAEFPTDIPDIGIDAEEPERPNIENLVDDATIPEIGDIGIPDEPVVSLPDEPTIDDIDLPTPPSVDIVPFALDFPEDTTDFDVQPFEYTESEYTSALNDAVKAKLLYDVENGGTGLDPEVETAIFERQNERDLIALEEAIQNLKAEWAKSGFPLPNGVLNAQIQDLYEKYQLTREDRSREVTIKQAELAQNNTQFAVTSGLQYESMMIQHAENVANRALDAAKSTVTLGIAFYNAQIDRFKTELEAYRVGAQAYESQIRAELAKVEVYKAEMQGAGLKADVQGQRVSIYRQQVEIVNALYGKYRTQLEGARTKAAVEAERLSAFRTRVQAQLDKVRGLVSIYQADTDRYNSDLRKGAAQADIKVRQQELQSRNAEASLRLAIENARANLQTFINTAQMNVESAQGSAKVYTSLAAAALDSLMAVVQLGATSSTTEE
jgi:hypothetical protein